MLDVTWFSRAAVVGAAKKFQVLTSRPKQPKRRPAFLWDQATQKQTLSDINRVAHQTEAPMSQRNQRGPVNVSVNLQTGTTTPPRNVFLLHDLNGDGRVRYRKAQTKRVLEYLAQKGMS